MPLPFWRSCCVVKRYCTSQGGIPPQDELQESRGGCIPGGSRRPDAASSDEPRMPGAFSSRGFNLHRRPLGEVAPIGSCSAGIRELALPSVARIRAQLSAASPAAMYAAAPSRRALEHTLFFASGSNGPGSRQHLAIGPMPGLSPLSPPL